MKRRGFLAEICRNLVVRLAGLLETFETRYLILSVAFGTDTFGDERTLKSSDVVVDQEAFTRCQV